MATRARGFGSRAARAKPRGDMYEGTMLTFCDLEVVRRCGPTQGSRWSAALLCALMTYSCSSDDMPGSMTTGATASGAGGSGAAGSGDSGFNEGGRTAASGGAGTGSTAIAGSQGSSSAGRGAAASAGRGGAGTAGSEAESAGSSGRGRGGTGGVPSETAGAGGNAAAGSSAAASGSGGSGAGSGGESAGSAGSSAGASVGAGGASAGAAGASAGAGGASEDDDAGVPPEEPGTPEDPGKGDGRDVILIGDSWMSFALGIGIGNSLLDAAGQPYRTYGIAGSELLNGQIAAQYALAKVEDADIKTVVMSAGGDDVFRLDRRQDCIDGGTSCAQTLMDIGGDLSELWQTMATDGVRDVVYVLFNADAGGGIADFADYADSLAQACAAAPLRCHFVTIDDLVMGELRLDGVHPSDAAFNRIGAAVFTSMVMERVAR